ncbi:SUF system NifU family Fe-S cluster assembly protein [Candidatus Uhrbacteria bacterium RIFOXYC2_FULL_47_19]|uniref:SUF system NifU family Fe-S cluster assembly protein n=1 Tax=Candidatus Uhrbacteria bacterium RIFOXYC2_FULL_47_19 TaxID=1802424 RepID=A0A1F7WDD6_9BACT|nr:MAG: SUF system NifU family Fe-S cluster assembly protein [Candidatus Uhrbacteria bacterium RIFOXYC2_FULL_47_19]HCC22539.1 SUF system NifU family Fe-S cluster assembly protein [Candidatus Uhrbacteria bacterium]
MNSIDHDRIGRADLYRQNILDHNRSPRNKRRMDNATISQREVNMSCGDDVEIFVRIEDDRITDLSFDGVGCAISQAATSMLTEKAKGLTTTEVLTLGRGFIFELLGVEVGPARLKCALLGLETLKKALQDISEKKQ